MVKIVGILNITPDSFSDGAKFIAKENALSHCQKLIDDGANIIDIGAESTRPSANKLSPLEEWQRLEPLLKDLIMLCKKNGVLSSLDSYHANNAAKAINLGIDIINDVSGFSSPEMINLAKKNTNTTFIIMHNLGIPANQNITIAEEQDPIEVINLWIEEKIKLLNKHQIAKERIIIDLGIGFGKTAKQSLCLINNINRIKSYDLKLMVGHSRKSFLSSIYPNISKERDIETLEISKILCLANIDFLRVHNVKIHKNLC